MWYADFIEIESGNNVVVKVCAKNCKEALKKVSDEIIKKEYMKPMKYIGISCI